MSKKERRRLTLAAEYLGKSGEAELEGGSRNGAAVATKDHPEPQELNRPQAQAPRLGRNSPARCSPRATSSYKMADEAQGVSCGGLGAVHLMARKIGVVDEINGNVVILTRHLPYHESDHVINCLAYNILAGGMRIEAIELRAMTRRTSRA